MKPTNFRARSFTLVLTLFATVVLCVTGGSLALTGAVESMAAFQQAAQFEHELAVDSFVLCLPQLLKATPNGARVAGEPIWVALSDGSCSMRGLVHSEKEKLHLTNADNTEATAATLRDLARRHGLPERNIHIRPMTKKGVHPKGKKYFWFSQIVQPTQFEEVFTHTHSIPIPGEAPRQKTWSDLVTFWNAPAGEVYAIDLETQIGDRSRRHWYIVVSVEHGQAKLLHQGPRS